MEADIVQKEPRLVEELLNYDIRKACAGQKYSMCLTNSGKVFVWGKGAIDQTENNFVDKIHIPYNPFEA